MKQLLAPRCLCIMSSCPPGECPAHPGDLSDDVARARRTWAVQFPARVRVMERLLANATEDDIPTPGGES